MYTVCLLCWVCTPVSCFYVSKKRETSLYNNSRIEEQFVLSCWAKLWSDPGWGIYMHLHCTCHGEAFKSSLYCACTLDMYTYYRKSYYIHGIGSLVTYKMECNVITCEDNEIMRPWCGMDRNMETSSL